MSTALPTARPSSRCAHRAPMRTAIHHEGFRKLRALNAHPNGATADILAKRLNITQTALRRWMRTAAAMRLVRVEKIAGIDRRNPIPRVRYYITAEGLKLIQAPDAQEARQASVLAITSTVPNSVFRLGDFLN